MKIEKMVLLLALAVLVLAASACAPAAPSTPALTLDALKNAEYTSDAAATKKAKLTNGTFQEQIAPRLASELTIKMLEPYAMGDLNGDGVADAAVVLATNTGGSGTFVSLWAVVNEAGKPKPVTSADLGDRTQVKSVSIANGMITVDLVAHGPNDPLCCPSQQVTQQYKLQGDKLILVK